MERSDERETLSASEERSRTSRRALFIAFGLGLSALAGAVVSLLVADAAVLLVLAISACVAAAGLVAAVASFGGARRAPSIIAVLASLFVLGAIALGFGAISIRGVVDAVDQARPSVAEHVDDDYRFRLRAPTFDSFVYDENSATRVNERAVGGVWQADEDVTMLVFVDQRYGRSLDEAARENARLVDGEEPDVSDPPRPTRFLGRRAIRITRAFANDDDTYDWVESTFFLHQDHVYQLMAQQTAAARPHGDPWFTAARASFSLTRGAVRDRFTVRHVARDDGQGWRVRDDVYEDAEWGLRMRGGDSTLRYSDDARWFGRGQIVLLERRNPDVMFGVRGVLFGGRDVATVVSSLQAELEAGAPFQAEPSLHLEVDGRACVFDALAAPDRPVLNRYGVVAVDAERAFEIIAWGPTLEVVDAALPELLEHIDLLDAGEMQALRDEIHETPQRDVGHQWWFSDGVFHENEAAIRWAQPSSRWRVGPEWEREVGSEHIVRFEAPSLGLEGRIVERQVEEGEHAHDEWIGRGFLDTSIDAPTIEQPDGHYTARLDDGDFVWAIATITEDGVAWHAEVWGTRRDFDRHADEALAAVRALSFEPIAEDSEEGFDVDVRMGYRFRRPWPAEGPFDAAWPTLDSEVGTLTQYSRGIELVWLCAARRDPTMTIAEQRDAWIGRYYGQLLRGPGRWTERRTRLGRQPATLRERSVPFSLGGTSVYTMEHGRVLYVLVVEHRGGIEPARIARGFSLL